MGCGISKATFRQTVVFSNENVYRKETVRGSANLAVTDDNESLLKIQKFSSVNSKTELLEERGYNAFTALRIHNECRQIHNALPLQLDLKMCQEAEEFAKILAKEKRLRHSSKIEIAGQGENLVLFQDIKGMTNTNVTEIWYSEVKDYAFQKPGFSFETGNFTQLVWKDSHSFGIGSAKYEKDGTIYTAVVARYYPAGNVLGEFDTCVSKGSYLPV